jgi:protocatechuate 4,5-dioxygenase alpha subunit
MEKEENRNAFTSDPASYLDRYPMTPDQRRLVEVRDWLGMLRAGGNIYYMLKLIAYDRSTLQHVGGQMTGMTVDEFREMLSQGRMGPSGLGPSARANG